MKIALLGFGKLGQAIVNQVREDATWADLFEVTHIWNRSPEAFSGWEFGPGVRICREVEEVIADLGDLDLVVECSHPSVLHRYGAELLAGCDVFVSSPTAFANAAFYGAVRGVLAGGARRVFLPIGASVGIWDIIRLDQNGQLKGLSVEMRKHPDSFRISDPVAVQRLQQALQKGEAVEVMADEVGKVNVVAPQNTNTMSIYALASGALGFEGCRGRIVADPGLEAHLVICEVETTLGLKLRLVRDNPARKDAVTGSATFSSFLNSLLHHRDGVSHRQFVFC